MASLTVPSHVPAELVRNFDFVSDLHPGDLYVRASKLHEGPDIFYTPCQEGHWVVTRCEDIESILRNTADFSNDNMSIPKLDNPYRLLPTESNPPLHADYRATVLPYFTPKAIGDLGRRARELTVSLIDNFYGKGACEFVSDFAVKMPIGIFLSLVNLPEADRSVLLPVVNEYVGGATEHDKMAAFGQLEAYMKCKIEERKANLGSDMLSAVLKAKVEGGRPLTESEILGFAILLLIGGLETVAGALGMFATFLARNEGHRRQLVDRPDLIPDAVEELLRRHAPVMFARTVARDVVYKGITMKAGDLMLILTAAAGLDSRRYPDPFKVDFRRANKKHFAFGSGIHTCIGSVLARTELRIFMEEWLRRIPDFSITAGTTPVLATGFSHSTLSLHLEWEPRA